jgi:hypothetical protein
MESLHTVIVRSRRNRVGAARAVPRYLYPGLNREVQVVAGRRGDREDPIPLGLPTVELRPGDRARLKISYQTRQRSTGAIG